MKTWDTALGAYSQATPADDAGKDNQLDIALKLYQLFIKQYPNATLIDFVKESLAKIEAKLNKP